MTEKLAKKGSLAVERLLIRSLDENLIVEPNDIGAFVRVLDVKLAIRRMAKTPRLSPETAERIIKSLELE